MFAICTEMCFWLWNIIPEAFSFRKSLPSLSAFVELAFLQLYSIHKKIRIKLRRAEELFSTSYSCKMKTVPDCRQRVPFASKSSLISPH